MKKAILFLLLAVATTASAANKNDSTAIFTTLPQMHCASCEARIKGNLRFEGGVKNITTDVPAQTVTVVYNPRKTTAEKLRKAFEKFGYTARRLKEGEKVVALPESGECENM